MSKVKDYLLFCPGPVNINQNIWQALTYHIGHREEEFSELLTRINQKILDIFEIRQHAKYYPLLVTGSGTAANETVLSSFEKKQRVLVLCNGEFGERLYTISKLYNSKTYKLAFQWAEQIDIKKVEKQLQSRKVDIIVMVHHETSTGMLNPVSEIGKLTRKYNIDFFVDAISSATAERIDIEKWNITFCTTTSGKAISSLPGIGIIISKVSSLEELKQNTKRNIYLNLYNLYHYSKTVKQTPNTPAVHLFAALDQALSNIVTVGVQQNRKIILERAFFLRDRMKKLGFIFLLDESKGNTMSSVLTTVMLPSHLSADYLKQKLKDRRIVIYNGKGPLLDRVFQVANIGNLTKHDLIYFLNSLEQINHEAKDTHLSFSAPQKRFSFLTNAFHLHLHRSK
jgi:2-aminoethylphosphonate-pyruvate transaminase